MTKQELRDLAAIGYVAKLKTIEAQLADDFKMFPEVFAGTAPPVLVKPELRNGKGKHWPIAVSKGKSKRGAPKVDVAAQRARSNELLLVIAEHGKPMQNAELVARGYHTHAAAPLARTGYLKHTKKGYVRTAKPYRLQKD